MRGRKYKHYGGFEGPYGLYKRYGLFSKLKYLNYFSNFRWGLMWEWLRIRSKKRRYWYSK